MQEGAIVIALVVVLVGWLIGNHFINERKGK